MPWLLGTISVLILAVLASSWVNNANGINLSPNEKRCFTSYTSTRYFPSPVDGDLHAVCIRDCGRCANNPRSSRLKKNYCRHKYDHCVRTKGDLQEISDKRSQQCYAAQRALIYSEGKESKANRTIFRTLCLKDCNTRNGCPLFPTQFNPEGCLPNRDVCLRIQV